MAGCRREPDGEDSHRPSAGWWDRAGWLLQLVLTLAGIHMSLAVGFTLRWHGQDILRLRHPVYGVALIAAAVGVRWLISRSYRHQCRHTAAEDQRLILDYNAGGRTVPWRAGLWWVMLPALVVLIAPLVARLLTRRSGTVLVAALLAWSIYLQGVGAYGQSLQRWYTTPINVDQAPVRLWDWTDPPFIYPSELIAGPRGRPPRGHRRPPATSSTSPVIG